MNRTDQRYIRRGHREPTLRYHDINQDRDGLDFDPPPTVSRHLWGCPGCSHQNDPRFASCRYCQTLRWGAAP